MSWWFVARAYRVWCHRMNTPKGFADNTGSLWAFPSEAWSIIRTRLWSAWKLWRVWPKFVSLEDLGETEGLEGQLKMYKMYPLALLLGNAWWRANCQAYLVFYFCAVDGGGCWSPCDLAGGCGVKNEARERSVTWWAKAQRWMALRWMGLYPLVNCHRTMENLHF